MITPNGELWDKYGASGWIPTTIDYNISYINNNNNQTKNKIIDTNKILKEIITKSKEYSNYNIDDCMFCNFNNLSNHYKSINNHHQIESNINLNNLVNKSGIYKNDYKMWKILSNSKKYGPMNFELYKNLNFQFNYDN